MLKTFHSENLNIENFKSYLGDKKYNMSIEHIVAQNAIENGSLEQYGFESSEEFAWLKNTFGNLLVIEKALNSQCSDAGLAKKQDIYKKSNVFYNRQFASREDFLSFNKDSIKQENEKFTKWVKEEFFKEFL